MAGKSGKSGSGKPGNPAKKVTSQEMLDEFDRITGLLEKIKEEQIEGDDNFNYFFAVGMHTQEIRHSAFLAFLLDPDRKHGLKNHFLKRFLVSLYGYKKPIADSNITPLYNNQILRAGYFTTAGVKPSEVDEIADLEKLSGDEEIEVLREVVVNSSGELLESPQEEETESKPKKKKSGDGRMDILIKFNKSKTLVVIENKLGFKLHDDQLKKYEEGLDNSELKDYKRIYVYLRMDDSSPLNDDGSYNSNWCVYDYEEIRGVIDGILKDTKVKVKKKLTYILEDYMAILTKENLKSKDGLETRQKIREFLQKQENVELVKLLCDYYDKDNDVFDYIYDELKKRLAAKGYNVNYRGGGHGDKSVNFTLPGLDSYKSKYNIKKEMVYRIASNPYIGGFLVGFDSIFPTIQSKAAVNIPKSLKFLDEKDRGFVDTTEAAIKAKLDAALDKFLDIVLTVDNIIGTL